MEFPVRRSAPDELSSTASFKQCFDYYCERVGLSECKAADYIRINQSHLNRINNGKIKNVDVSILVCICLVLRLSEDEAKDFLARRERAFSPANDAHSAYLELIRMYSEKKINCEDIPEKYLEEADDYLISKGKKPLPITNL